MPELPEVETVVQGLRPLLVGARIERLIIRRPDIRFPLPPDLGQRLTGATVIDIRRRAKFGLIDTDRADTLIFHLGMSGKFRPAPAVAGPHDHLQFDTDRGSIAYTDPRRFGFFLLAPAAEALAHPMLAGLGPEPLGPAFTAETLIASAAGRAAPVKAILLDQHAVAGIGNIYACEALFAAGIHPARAAGRISARRLADLTAQVKAVLAEAIAAGGSTLRDHARPSGELGYFQHSFKVYGREGEPCVHCHRPIARIVQSGRSTFFCPRCQR